MRKRPSQNTGYSFDDLDREMEVRKNTYHIQNECTLLSEIRLIEHA